MSPGRPMENHAFKFLWSSRLAAWFAGTCAVRRTYGAQDGGHIPEIGWPLLTSAYIFHIGHSCCGQLAAVEVTFFVNFTADQVTVFRIGSQAEVPFFCPG